MLRSRDVKEAPRFNFPGKLRAFSCIVENISSFTMLLVLFISMKLLSKNWTNNMHKNFVYSQNIFRVSVADTASVREVHHCEPKHRCCKLSVLCTHRYTLRPHQSTQSLLRCTWCWRGHKVNLCVHDKTDRQFTTAMFWFTEVDFSDDGGGCHWNMMEYSLTVYEIFWIVMYASSQYPEGPATGHLDTGFPWFPCVYKRTLRWFPSFPVAAPDLNFLVTFFFFYICVHVK